MPDIDKAHLQELINAAQIAHSLYTEALRAVSDYSGRDWHELDFYITGLDAESVLDMEEVNV